MAFRRAWLAVLRQTTKKGPEGPFFIARYELVRNAQISGRLFAVTARLELELDHLTLVKGREAGLLDGGNVNEGVLTPGLWTNEAVAFGGIEPLDGPFHSVSSNSFGQSKATGAQRKWVSGQRISREYDVLVGATKRDTPEVFAV